MGLKEKILGKCDERIAAMQKTDCPQWVREKAIKERQVSKEMLEIVCGIQGITPDGAIQIFNESKEIIKEAAMAQKI